MTALAEKMKAAGVNTARAQLECLAKEQLAKSKGEVTRAVDRLWPRVGISASLLVELLGEDQIRQALRGLCERLGGGQVSYEPRSNGAPAKPVSLVNRRAALSVAQVRVSIFEETLLSGERIGDLHWHELEKFAGRATREGAWARLILASTRVSDPFALVRDSVSEREMQRLKQKAAEVQDEH